MKKPDFKKMIKPLVGIAAVLCVAFCAAWNVFYGLDALVTDALYKNLTGVDERIVILSIDEETVSAYADEGKFTEWARSKCADLLEQLYSDTENKPAVVGLDIMFVEDGIDRETDERLARAAALGNTVVASNIVYRGRTERDADGTVYYNSLNIDHVAEPYKALNDVVTAGFSNAFMAKDGIVRYAMCETEDPKKESFAFALYSQYCKSHGMTVEKPKTNSIGRFMVYYSGEPGEFQHFSLCDVLGSSDYGRFFKDAIVLVGAYAPGFQDDYYTAVNRGERMYGVENHANIIQALFEGKTALPADRILFFAVTAVLAAAFLLAASKQKLVPVIIESVVLGAAYCFAGRILAGKGIFITAAYFLIFLILADVYYVIEKYFLEKWRRRRTLEVFKKYVAPQVIDDISKSGDFVLKLGGEKRDVAVLFVDIRGFTPLSESLQPEQVVAILNEYLALTTKSILNNHGTLDKFIGDATMAVFNAPFDQEDYIYSAVCAAWDIKQGSQELGERLYKQFNKTVGFGVGVNCGPAVVGNIGCEFRMDYTAIGDTVNTAARLEANAKAEEILISEYVYEKLKDRITTEEVGEIPLKGKSTKLMVYRVLDIVKRDGGESASTPGEDKEAETAATEAHAEKPAETPETAE
ncbi:MAG: adenylate/guanylate cyclase domain-containing protein [Lachnospiraceae bacterium]|nr:adenylate/guanylate cyclase domain-containing protein [Lachnospiraceae bacterium]